MKKVIILLGTYNGEKYLAEQLDSICSQTYEDWELVIRDDVSSDKTVEIINDYITRDNRIKMIPGQTNLGQVRNYEELTKVDTGDNYVMYSDQDDVWKPNKIQRTLDEMIKIEKENQGLPVMVYTDKTYVDQDLNMLSIQEKKLSDDFFFDIMPKSCLWMYGYD